MEKILVIRDKNPEKVMNFLSQFGLAFQEERHESGPTHWACVHKDLVLEVYPLRDQKAEKYLLELTHEETIDLFESIEFARQYIEKLELPNAQQRNKRVKAALQRARDQSLEANKKETE